MQSLTRQFANDPDSVAARVFGASAGTPTRSADLKSKWTLVMVCAQLLTVWEIVDHTLLSTSPISGRNGLELAVTLLFLVLGGLALVDVRQRYRDELHQVTTALVAQTACERVTHERLLDVSRDLSFTASGLAGHVEIALQSTTDLPNIKALSDAVDRVEILHSISRRLLDLQDTMPAAGEKE